MTFFIDATDRNLAWLGYGVASKTLGYLQSEGVLADVVRISGAIAVAGTAAWLAWRVSAKALRPAISFFVAATFLVYGVTVERSSLRFMRGQEVKEGSAETLRVPWGLWAIAGITGGFWAEAAATADQAMGEALDTEPEIASQYYIGLSRAALSGSTLLMGEDLHRRLVAFSTNCQEALVQSRIGGGPLGGDCAKEAQRLDSALMENFKIPMATDGLKAVLARVAVGLEIRYALTDLEVRDSVTEEKVKEGLAASVWASVKHQVVSLLRSVSPFYWGSLDGAITRLLFFFGSWILGLAASPVILSVIMGVTSVVTLCLFPVTVLASFVPAIGWRAYATYAMGMFWVQSWPFYYQISAALSGFAMKVVTSGAGNMWWDATGSTGYVIGDALLAARGVSGEVLTGSTTSLVQMMFTVAVLQLGVLLAIPVFSGFVLLGAGSRWLKKVSAGTVVEAAVDRAPSLPKVDRS